MGDGRIQRYALIVNGDTEPRHRENVNRAIRALRREGPYDISVASTQKPEEKVEHFQASDQASLQSLVQGLQSRMHDDDVLALYITGHGSSEDNGCVNLPDTCLSLESLQKQIDVLPYGKRIVMMDNCFSGKGLRLFANPKTSVVTQGSPGETVSCQTFSPYFWSDQVPDANSDGVVSLQERYQFALETGKTVSLTQFFSPEPIGFSGNIGALPFANENNQTPLVEVHKGEELQKQINKLKPGQLALVDFSADWCGPCRSYKPHFEKLARQYQGRYLMIHAEGIDGSETDWGALGIKEYPTVAFMDEKGKLTPVGDRFHPEDSEILASLRSKSDQLKTIADRLQSKDPEAQLRGLLAVQANKELGAQALPYILPLLESKLEKLRQQACFALADIGPPAAVATQKLSQLLNEPIPPIQKAAIGALAKIGFKAKSATPHLLRLLQDPQLETRCKAWIQEQGYSPAEAERLGADLAWELKVAAAQSLAKIDPKDPELFLQLIKIGKNPKASEVDRQIVLFAARDFGSTAMAGFHDLVQLLKTEATSARARDILEDLSPQFPKTADYFIQEMQNKSQDPFFRFMLINLAELNKERGAQFRDICERLALDKKEDPRLRQRALLALKAEPERMRRVSLLVPELKSVPMHFKFGEPQEREKKAAANFRVGLGGTFFMNEAGHGGGANLNLGYSWPGGWEPRFRLSLLGFDGKADKKGPEIRASLSGAFRMGSKKATFRPLLLFPEIGFSHRVPDSEWGFHGSPLGLGVETVLGKDWNLEFSGRPTLDYTDKISVGGEGALTIVKAF